jgi:hypothetical protein
MKQLYMCIGQEVIMNLVGKPRFPLRPLPLYGNLRVGKPRFPLRPLPLYGNLRVGKLRFPYDPFLCMETWVGVLPLRYIHMYFRMFSFSTWIKTYKYIQYPIQTHI